MLVVERNYKLIEMDGDIKEINTSEAWSVFECESPDGVIKVNEMDMIEFTIEDTGEIKTGVVTKISGKEAKTKIQIKPNGNNCEEIWEVTMIKENSLKVIEKEESEEETEY